MDKEILRIVIIGVGLVIILVMLAWAYFKDRKSQEEFDYYDEDFDIEVTEDILDEFDIVPIERPVKPFAPVTVQDDDDIEPPPRPIAPAIIQFCILAKTEDGFNGHDLLDAFKRARLQYGNLKIFERLDENRLVDFGVACIAAPGTFPNMHFESFYCPGLVFFMQPGALEDPMSVFEDYIETIRGLAIDLDGDIIDHEKKPLTDATIQTIRMSL